MTASPIIRLGTSVEDAWRESSRPDLLSSRSRVRLMIARRDYLASRSRANCPRRSPRGIPELSQVLIDPRLRHLAYPMLRELTG